MKLRSWMKCLRQLAAPAAVAALAACAERPPLPPVVTVAPPQLAAPAPEQPSFTQAGIASWYGGRHHGRKTASGERFDMNAMTAAHRSLKMGTVLRVTNLANGRTVSVRINDRGPHVRGRIIDLSAAAARALAMQQDGVAQVRVEAFASDQPRAMTADVAPLPEPAQ